MQEQATAVQHTEARILGWAKFRDPLGATWSVTMREGATGAMAADLAKNCEGMTKYLIQHGWTPDGVGISGEGEGGVRICPKHGAEMQMHNRNGDTWWSHKLADGTWCKGK